MLPRLTALPLLVVAILTACGSDPGDDTGDDAAGMVAPNTQAAVRELATAIYDAVDTNNQVDLYVEGVMAAFNVPALTEPADLDARLAARLPAFTLPQTLDLAAAFAADNHVELDAFLAALTEHGLHRAGGGAIDRAFLDERFTAIAAASSYETDEVLPALVLALSAERTRRYGADSTATTDPLWGDGLLDPLQTTLLLFAIGAEVSGVSAPPPERRGYRHAGEIRDFVIDHAIGQVEGRALDGVEWPTGPDDLAQSAPCVSLALYGHKLSVTATPDYIYHHQIDVPAPPAYISRIDTKLEFLDDYWDNYPQVKGWVFTTLIGLAGCNLPRQGTVPGKPLTWSVGADLEPHGNYDVMSSMTDGDGGAWASWRAVRETTPVMHRTLPNLEVAVDWMKVRAGNLVPGWNTLALVAGGLKRLPDTGVATLHVRYYKNPCAGGFFGGGQCIDEWYGSAEMTDGNYKVTGTDLVWRSVVTGDGSIIYEIASGTISYEMSDPSCTVAFSPSTVSWDPQGSVASQLDYRFTTTPRTFSGSGSMFWMSQMTVTCPDGSNTIPQLIGGQFFRADPTPQSGEVLADNYTIMGQHYVYSFHR